MITPLLTCLALILLLITALQMVHLIGPKNNPASRSPSPHSLSTYFNPPTPGILAQPIRLCTLSNPLTCTGEYRCLPYASSFSLYNSALDRMETWPANQGPDEGYCVPRPPSPARCYPSTGQAVLIQRAGYYHHLCLCKYPSLVTKRRLFDNCDVKVGCGVGGQLTPSDVSTYDPFIQGVCLCPPGHVSLRDQILGPTCRKTTYEDEIKSTFCLGGTVVGQTCQCPPTHLLVSPTGPDFIHPSFRQQLTTTLCVKNPCLYSAHWPEDRLPRAKLSRVTKTCLCDPLHGSFPIYSEQSILRAHKNNACQTFDRLIEYADITYECYFYGSEPRTCWFLYRLWGPTRVLGKMGSWVKVLDTSFWIDRIWPKEYFSRTIMDHLQRKWANDLGLFGSVLLTHDTTDDSLAHRIPWQSCQHQYLNPLTNPVGRIVRLCTHHKKIFLSPLVARDQGWNGLVVENALAILKDRNTWPIVSFRHFEDQPPPRTFPLDMTQ